MRLIVLEYPFLGVTCRQSRHLLRHVGGWQEAVKGQSVQFRQTFPFGGSPAVTMGVEPVEAVSVDD
ncbi:hypothetical protein [Sphingomonas sp.]|uniref:hypothetical protein n=1 Tax=Sphingomonas sp. TaxID=28214 RepID=UPI00259096C0|nr:hypothetical protein [Sphingomonas sp.]